MYIKDEESFIRHEHEMKEFHQSEKKLFTRSVNDLNAAYSFTAQHIAMKASRWKKKFTFFCTKFSPTLMFSHAVMPSEDVVVAAWMSEKIYWKLIFHYKITRRKLAQGDVNSKAAAAM